jgi:NodT family efflux transporter outer membrane factor (OMF) lipoprotein
MLTTVSPRTSIWLALTGVLLLSSACMVGPKYKQPAAPVPQAYKEPPPAGWKEAQPNDGVIRGKWWEIYNDPALNALEEQVSITNQNVLAAEAQYRAAKYSARIARSALFPTVGAGPSISSTARSNTLFNTKVGNITNGVLTSYDFSGNVSYLADVWGDIRRTVRANEEIAQATYAQLENARLAFQAELASDYFQLHGTDGDLDLLERTVASYQDYLVLTQNRFKSGVASGADVAQAQAQLETTRAQLVDLRVARAQLEHAIAMLTGKPPAAVTLPALLLKTPPPPIPVSLPSSLLERRPDIAAAERQMASVHEQIGIAQAAFYPSLNFTGSAGFQSSDVTKWFTWPSHIFSISPQALETIFEGGKRRATVAQAKALFDSSVATYRQTVLTAFQQVEDNLVALRVLEEEAAVTDRAVKAAEDSLNISTYQYKAGTVAYLQVLIAQATALTTERAAVDILTRRMVASVQLVEALGGGWDAATLPTPHEILNVQ